MIFCGDLFQHPPVMGAALYSRVSEGSKTSDNELYKRLGHLAWMSFTDVVELTEQNRMKDDPDYAAAVNWL